MNYLIFDNDIYYDIDDKTGIAARDKVRDIFKGSAKDALVVIIDTIQKQVAAPEKSSSKKDEVIASSFSGDYVIQSEQISRNLFQVIAIEKPKVAEVYKYLGFENVRQLLPYGVALREFLKSNNLFGQNKRIVFLDYLGNQVLLTIFNNDIFTTPRRLSVAVKRVASELTRSQENYKALNKDEKEASFLIATNSKEIMDEIVSSGLETKENIIYFTDSYPSLRGLTTGKFSMHYLLPEQFIRLRKLKAAKSRLLNLGGLLGVLAAFLIFLLGSFNANVTASMRLKSLLLEKKNCDKALKRAYFAKYKDILRQTKKIDFPYYFSSFINALPPEYKLESITISAKSCGACRFKAIVYQEANQGAFIELVLPRAFKQARKDYILVKDSPAIRVVLDIF